MRVGTGLKITELPINKIKPYEKNPRKNNRAVIAVKRSIEEFGMRWPIIIDKDNVIVAGHTRFQAAKELGFTSIPTMTIDNLSESQIKAFRIADNRTSDFADWDVELLSAELEELDFDMDWLELSDLGLSSDFLPTTEDEQGKLDERKPVFVTCPHCGEKFEYVKD